MRTSSVTRFLLLPLVCLALTACGISFGGEYDGTELFKGIDLSGERRVGETLTVTAILNPSYPVPVEIACFYEDDDKLTSEQMRQPFEMRAAVAGRAVLPPSDADPPDDVDRVTLSFDFVVEEPGEYFIACNSPAAPENGFGMSFIVRE